MYLDSFQNVQLNNQNTLNTCIYFISRNFSEDLILLFFQVATMKKLCTACIHPAWKECVLEYNFEIR